MFPTCVIQIQLLIVCLFWYYSAFQPSSGVGKAGLALSETLRDVKSDEVFQSDADAVSVKRLRGTKVNIVLLSEIVLIVIPGESAKWHEDFSYKFDSYPKQNPKKSLFQHMVWCLFVPLCTLPHILAKQSLWCSISAVNKTAAVAWQNC